MNLIYPISNVHVTGRFGETGGPYGNRPHRGVDFSAVVGTPVRAVHDGIVHHVEDERGGLGIWLRDGQVATYYAHLSRQLHAGQRVAAGTIIGLSGNSGYSTGPHLHFGLQVAAKWMDPEPLFAPIPEDEPAADLATLAEKARWWMEEILRAEERGELGWAMTLKRSQIKLLYRLEGIAKGT